MADPSDSWGSLQTLGVSFFLYKMILNGQMDGPAYRQMDRQTDRWTDGRTNGRRDVWTCGNTDGQTDI